MTYIHGKKPVLDNDLPISELSTVIDVPIGIGSHMAITLYNDTETLEIHAAYLRHYTVFVDIERALKVIKI